MLKPNKYTNLNLSMLSIASDLLLIFKKNNLLTYSSLLKSVTNKKGIQSKQMILPSLNLLFLLGKIQYHKEGDLIEFIK